MAIARWSKERTTEIKSVGLLTAVWAVYFAHGLVNSRTIHADYKLIICKAQRPLRIGYIADLHYGHYNYKATQDMIKRLAGEKLNALILGGDIIDGRTPVWMRESIFKDLGSIPTTYGTFFVQGNNDRAKGTIEDSYIEELLSKGNVKNLTESIVALPGKVMVYGREDFYDEFEHKRSRLGELEIREDYYNIVIDHAPVTQKLASKLGFDLMLCGHTHDQQLLTLKIYYSILGAVCAGWQKIGKMDLLVTPGAGCNHVHYRSGSKCKYHVINLVPENME